MDNSHVALVSLMLKAESFSPYRCDRNIALGVNLTSLTKVLRAAQNEDILTLKAEDAPDVLNLVFESSENDRISEYDLKLMDIDQEHLGIPETEYAATVTMPASEFRRICTDLNAMSESVSIDASKDGIKFSAAGDIGNGSVTLRSHTNVDKPQLNVDISLSEPVSLTFSLKYLVNFCKAAVLSDSVKICLSSEVPLLVEYNLEGNSFLRFYLAPKVCTFFFLFSHKNIVVVMKAALISYYRLAKTSKQQGVNDRYVEKKELTQGKWKNKHDWWYSIGLCMDQICTWCTGRSDKDRNSRTARQVGMEG